MSSIALRAPSSASSAGHSEKSPIKPPKLSWIEGTWNVTHSTLPMWEKNRNVRITYTRIPNTTPAQLDDVVNYQPLNSSSIKTVHGTDKPFNVPGVTVQGAESEDTASLGYHWRGKGWLKVATSQWEILGHGEEEGTGTQWVVTHFAKTMFTPEGIDIYSRHGQLQFKTVEAIRAALNGLGGPTAAVASGLFIVVTDEELC